MNIILSLLSIILGLIILTLGGNKLVDGAISLARKFHISEAIIGLTIVAIGTSMPELIVSVLAALRGSTEIAIGNVLGSNIANIFLILGITAIIGRMKLSETTRFFDLPVVIFSTLLLLLLVSDRFLDDSPLDIISRSDGIILLTFACLYIFYSLKHNNLQPDKSEEIEIIESNWKLAIALVGGIGALFVGGKILVDGAVELAKMGGISESVIGLTIVAIGTSAPELATSIIAARRGSPELAIGNVVGSNIMNILIILGVTAFMGPIPFLAGSFIDILVALFAPISVLMLSLVWTKNELGKKEGILMLTLYSLYIILLLAPYITL